MTKEDHEDDGLDDGQGLHYPGAVPRGPEHTIERLQGSDKFSPAQLSSAALTANSSQLVLITSRVRLCSNRELASQGHAPGC